MDKGLVKIRRALLSVSDKTGIVDLARELSIYDVEIISTGGTAKTLREAGIKVRDISDVTGFPELMGGRVKTLHPKVHGALLGLRDNPAHAASMSEHGIEPIDLLVVDLYPFEETIAREDVTLEEAIEQIDIGGPAMIRSAAKNYRDVAVVTSPQVYQRIQAELMSYDGALTLTTRGQLARLAFLRTALYDSVIFPYLSDHVERDAQLSLVFPPIPDILAGMTAHMNLFSTAMKTLAMEEEDEGEKEELDSQTRLGLIKLSDLRYGENPHQPAALYELVSRPDEPAQTGVAQAELLSGKEMSYNNYVDADAAWQLVCDFDDTACAIIKHMNPAGVALGDTAEDAYRKALACDPVSAFGGIVAFNRGVDEAAARAVIETFTEVIIAPGFDEASLEILRGKKNLRVLNTGNASRVEGLEYRTITGGMLVQGRDSSPESREDYRVVTSRPPSEEEWSALELSWTVCKHTKSNAIVYARSGQTVGVGAGQMSRIDAVKLGAMRAQLEVKGSVLASDAFFPFRDGTDEAARHGVSAIIQPGGSVRDQEGIDAANEHGIAMVFTGIRHFRH